MKKPSDDLLARIQQRLNNKRPIDISSYLSGRKRQDQNFNNSSNPQRVVLSKPKGVLSRK